MSITTFSQLIAEPASRKIGLAKIILAEALAYAWTLHSGNCYKITYGRDTINLTDGFKHILIEEASAIKVDGTSYTENFDAATVISTSYSYWHDVANLTLYVNFGGTNPNTTAMSILAYFPLFLSTGTIGKDLGMNLSVVGSSDAVFWSSDAALMWGVDSALMWRASSLRYFDPYILSIPTIAQVNNQISGGYSTISASELVLQNSNGFFDILMGSYVWENREVTLYFGGESLPFEEYRQVFKGIITGKKWDRDKVNLTMRSSQDKLSQIIPLSSFTITSYPNANPNIIGQPIPIGYGTFVQRTAPIVSAIDEVTYYGSDTIKFCVAGHAIYSIDNVWVSYDNGATWTQCTLSGANPPSSANKYYPDIANGNVWVRFNATSYNTTTNIRPLVKVAFKGTMNADTTLMTSPSDMVKDILITYLGFSLTSDLDATSFSDSKSKSNATMQIYLNSFISALDVLTKICQGDGAYLTVKGNGLWNYVVWEPSRYGTFIALTERDLLGGKFLVEFNKDNQFNAIRVAHSQALEGAKNNNSYLYAYDSDSAARYIYGDTAVKIVDTFLDNDSDAAVIASRLKIIHRYPLAEVKGSVKWQICDKDIGDKISFTTSRAPYGSGVFVDFVCELTSITKNFSDGTISFSAIALNADIAGYSVGIWTSASAANWATSTALEKASQGYWDDANGYADATDATSKNVSTWW